MDSSKYLEKIRVKNLKNEIKAILFVIRVIFGQNKKIFYLPETLMQNILN